jgi:hypothetical protein
VTNDCTKRIRCAIVGNSNSIQRGCYAEILSENPAFEISNFSIGGSTNVLLLHFLTRLGESDYDYIIVESSVIDYDTARVGLLYEEEIRNTAEIFMSVISIQSRAKVALLILPIRYGLATPEAQFIDRLYTKIAQTFGAWVLSAYDLFYQIVGLQWQGIPTEIIVKTHHLFSAFEIRRLEVLSYLWQITQSQKWILPPLARHLFRDDLHISLSFHQIIADLLQTFLLHRSEESAVARTGYRKNERGLPDREPVLSSAPKTDGPLIQRSSKLITETFALLDDNNEIIYNAPENYRASAILANRSATCGVVRIEGSIACTEIDLRSVADARLYSAVVVPVPVDIGDGPFKVSVWSGEGRRDAGRRFWNTIYGSDLVARAELAQLILVDRAVVPGATNYPPVPHDSLIHQLDWVPSRVRQMATQLGIGMTSVEQHSSLIIRASLDDVINSITSDMLPQISQARIYVATGDLERALAKLNEAVRILPDSPKVHDMLTCAKDLRDALA